MCWLIILHNLVVRLSKGAAPSFANCAAKAVNQKKFRPFAKANIDNLYWPSLSRNPNAIHLLEAHPSIISWPNLSENPNAIHLLEANPDKIDWVSLSTNPNAIHLLKANPDKIKWR